MNPEKQEEQEKQRIGLCIDKESKPYEYKGAYGTDYLTAITNTVFDHATQLSDKKFQQHFFQNFTEYLSPQTKGWTLWEDFQKVSRKYEEFKLENICKKLNITFDSASIDSEKKKFDDYLYDLRGQIAVEVAKTNPRIDLYLYYDPEYTHAFDVRTSDSIFVDDLMTIVAGWSDGVATEERQVANGDEESYPSHTLRYVYHNKEELTGRVYLYGEGHDNSVVMYDLEGKLTNIMPWERDEALAVTWKEECRTTNLTLDPAYVANTQHENVDQLNDWEQKSMAKQDNSAKTETLVEINPLEIREESKQKTDQTIQPKSTHPDKSLQLKDLASRHHQKSLSDFITAANVQHKADNQLNNRQQNSPTKQNVSMDTRTEKPLVKVDSWENREGLKKETDKNQGKKRVGQLIKSWENRQDSNLGQVLDNRSQTTGIATLNSRKQR
ncbi:hypothetical protein [Enterococcus faecium]|uniref:hypothetical protein n=1 Tax=Enterococcus faecium TaxID=1352 RepID=UPI003CC604A6